MRSSQVLTLASPRKPSKLCQVAHFVETHRRLLNMLYLYRHPKCEKVTGGRSMDYGTSFSAASHRWKTAIQGLPKCCRSSDVVRRR